jgi:hypothetical protein
MSHVQLGWIARRQICFTKQRELEATRLTWLVSRPYDCGHAHVAELVDALDSGSSPRKGVEVRVFS